MYLIDDLVEILSANDPHEGKQGRIEDIDESGMFPKYKVFGTWYDHVQLMHVPELVHD